MVNVHRDEPQGADVGVRVGTDRLGGAADENWSASDTYGNSAGVTWEGEGRLGAKPRRVRTHRLLHRHYYCSRSTTLLFCWRPASVVLSATGSDSAFASPSS